MKKHYFLLVILLAFSCFAMGQQLTYKPLNPAFGGDTFNYNWLLSSANAQNGLRAPATARDQQSDLERFGSNLNSQILSQISRSLLRQQIEGVGDLTEPGIYTFGTLNIEIFESAEGLVINLLDTATGEETQVIVPN
jgi:curli production assembly/transport component CsgF